MRHEATVPCILAIAIAMPAHSLLAAQRTWTVSGAPEVRWGTSGSDPHEQFVNVTGVAVLPGGELAVLDEGVPVVRLFAADGHWLRDLGRTGDGPGEYRDPVAIGLTDRGVAVLDRTGRLETVSPSARPVASDRVPLGGIRAERFNALPDQPLADGSALLRASERVFGRVHGEYRQHVGLLVASRGGVRDTVGWFVGDSGRTDAKGAPVPRPYLPSTGLLFDAGGARIAVMTADDPEVRIFDLHGKPVASWRAPLVSGPISSDDIDRLTEDALRGLRDNDLRVAREWIEGRPLLDHAPLAERVLVPGSRPGEVWLAPFGRPSGRQRWVVMSEQGRELARLELPPGVELLAAASDYVIGLSRDEYDVETIGRYRLQVR